MKNVDDSKGIFYDLRLTNDNKYVKEISWKKLFLDYACNSIPKESVPKILRRVSDGYSGKCDILKFDTPTTINTVSGVMGVTGTLSNFLISDGEIDVLSLDINIHREPETIKCRSLEKVPVYDDSMEYYKTYEYFIKELYDQLWFLGYNKIQ